MDSVIFNMLRILYSFLKMQYKFHKNSVVSEIWSVDVGTTNDPYASGRTNSAKIYSVKSFSKNSYHIETSWLVIIWIFMEGCF